MQRHCSELLRSQIANLQGCGVSSSHGSGTDAEVKANRLFERPAGSCHVLDHPRPHLLDAGRPGDSFRVDLGDLPVTMAASVGAYVQLGTTHDVFESPNQPADAEIMPVAGVSGYANPQDISIGAAPSNCGHTKLAVPNKIASACSQAYASGQKRGASIWNGKLFSNSRFCAAQSQTDERLVLREFSFGL